MNWLHTLLLVFHMLFAAGIVGLVLLQRGKGAEAGAGFGAGASGTVFGARGSASFLSRSTAVLATLFIVTSLALAYMSSKPQVESSVMDTMPAASDAAKAAATPVTPAPDASKPAAVGEPVPAEATEPAQPTGAPTK